MHPKVPQCITYVSAEQREGLERTEPYSLIQKASKDCKEFEHHPKGCRGFQQCEALFN